MGDKWALNACMQDQMQLHEIDYTFIGGHIIGKYHYLTILMLLISQEGQQFVDDYLFFYPKEPHYVNVILFAVLFQAHSLKRWTDVSHEWDVLSCSVLFCFVLQPLVTERMERLHRSQVCLQISVDMLSVMNALDHIMHPERLHGFDLSAIFSTTPTEYSQIWLTHE